ncbi:MAG TPA: GTP 3',8-cyclase MoaA [Bacteroidia bacterium]|nr:GTP 3',8-cyclase MoaA [Bacteroidia bacterium]
MIENIKKQSIGTLKDSFGRVHDYLRISITDRCNLRCTYCMPSDKMIFSPSSKLMTAKEIHAIASVFVKLGVKKIRLTGGEPLIRADAKQIIRLLAELPVELAISTNATRVKDFIDDFKNAGICAVNVSLDTFNKENFFHITHRDDFDKVMSNIHLLLKHNFLVKINAVVMNGINHHELWNFVEFTKHNPVHIRFIEFMPFPGNGWNREKIFSYREMLDFIGLKFEMEKLADEKNSTAKKYKVPGYAGTFAFINTITLPFCGDCNRLRLFADGKIKNCLFSNEELDLLTAFRKGEDIHELIFSSLKNKKKETGGQDFSLPTNNRSMIAIGG